MDRFHVPIMADSMLSSIATFHTTNIIVTHPSKFVFVGAIPESMYAFVPPSSKIIQEYKKLPSSGPRELTADMVKSIEDADKPAKRGKKPEVKKGDKGGQVSKVQTPRKRKSEKAAPTQPKPKKAKKPARRLILQSSSNSDSEYVPPNQPTIPPSESDSESSKDEVTIEPPVTTTPPSPTQSTETNTVLGGDDLEFDSTYISPYRVQSDDYDDAPVTKRHLKTITDKLDQLLSSTSTGAYSEAALKALFSFVVQEHDASLSAASKAIDASTSQCQKASLAVETSRKECKDATAKVEKLIFEAQLFLDSLQLAAQKNSQTVNASVDNLQRFLETERTNLEVARKGIEAANENLHNNVNDRLTQLEAELAVENQIMDELDKRTSQLKIQNLKLRSATTELNDLKSKREVIRSSVGDVHSIIQIEGVSVTPVQPKQGGEKENEMVNTQPHPEPKSTAAPKDNVASGSKRDKKKKKIREDDEDDNDFEDILGENPSKPF
ncbi:uncharacterized protein LOC111918175 [Lactuca sativa]|uniref:uncharacterized protein LOC111918175 n=1 Tax=Lactuca sativa TaxID=4236 RepID=UPI000CD8E0F0|nr:uncharacterized protein LOC111918175 [Lactuca sativa]